MEAWASYLLEQSDTVLFRAGGCHVFALALRSLYGYPLLWVKEDGKLYDHVACDAGDGYVLDFFGTFSHEEYVRSEKLYSRQIEFVPIEEAEVKSRFVLEAGLGYYAHPDFMLPATERANTWIMKHHEYFDGTRRCAIPGVSRVEVANLNEIL